MPWGWECRSRLVKQVQTKPTERRRVPGDDLQLPGPGQYDPPEIFCGKGFSKIKQSPAYTFGHRTPLLGKPAAMPNAPMFNIQGMARKGCHRITHSIIRPHCIPPGFRMKIPGPGAHSPQDLAQIKRPPAYSMRIAAKPPYEPYDMWTCPPNMYNPYIPKKSAPAFSFGPSSRQLKPQNIPGPGDHDPKFEYVKKTKPAFSFGAPFRNPRGFKTPAPNTYCEKKYMYTKPSTPAPSFGIRHSPYVGKPAVYLKPSKLELLAKDLA
ncbi:outer dense fiber protein 3-like protein 2 [Pectinophora gossypiella]|uniref:outer dense fiber protein 3-like protein 2 n=1 Tax=Pectinophora gossypiella TaxID=13191 RepID=UPI00214EB3C3|nr:outer dense fiber protein 3-like protein 2 [Pectinophora gossypiella]